jgi:Glycine zipper
LDAQKPGVRTCKGFAGHNQPAGTTQEEFMKKALMLLVLGASLASCTATEKGAGIGAASGAIIGGAVTGNVRGAAVGAAIGGVSGAVIGNVSEQPGQCYYRDRYGRRYIDDCPRRY